MSLDSTDVVVRDCGVDVCLARRPDGRPLLIVSPYQTFGFATRAVARLLPEASECEIRAALRARLSNSIDVDEMIRPAAREPYRDTWAAWTERLVSVTVAALLMIGLVLIFNSGNAHPLIEALLNLRP